MSSSTRAAPAARPSRAGPDPLPPAMMPVAAGRGGAERRRPMPELRPGERLAGQAVAFVLAGGRGSRLLELTDKRAKPAVHFGGKSRIIDFALSNAVNSGIRRIAVATQYKAHSLIRHLQR